VAVFGRSKNAPPNSGSSQINFILPLNFFNFFKREKYKKMRNLLLQALFIGMFDK